MDLTHLATASEAQQNGILGVAALMVFVAAVPLWRAYIVKKQNKDE